ncbi:LysR family transcriptional regulator [Alkalihalobacillus hwajinpoensis]|uniref:LysR family transcriptional regulator n=1 Tax=Guptibacillus hwajinpoensis TaxID=208199 RepID=UPI001883ECD2|nr:LysR family transcriptional regulator [Pseudalkalibacillus hwajinpoensis]MBF0707860.1 LysR family transcriptional regulator [Pseudalkalibacillus hwajinpoensis]
MLPKLTYFIKIADERSFTRAAKALFVSQPALSKQMKNLEEELGFTLFNRSVKGVELTTKGQAFYEDIKPLFTQINQTVDRYKKFDQIRFGSTPILSTYFLPGYYEQLQYSNVHVTAIREDSLDLVPQLTSHEIDAAIVQNTPVIEGMYSTFLFSEPFVAAVPASLSLAKKKEVTLVECFRYTQIIPPTGYLSERVRGILNDHLFEGDVLETHYLGMGGLVALGIGIAYLPKMMADSIEQKGVVFLPIKGEPLGREMYLHTNSHALLSLLSASFDHR